MFCKWTLPLLVLIACDSAQNVQYPPPILNTPAAPCRIEAHSGGTLYDTKMQVECEIGKLNGKIGCLPVGMWEEVGAAWATPECDRIFDWSKRNGNSCLDGRSNFVLSSAPRAGLSQTCGDFRGFIYRIAPTDRRLQYIKESGCSLLQNFELDLSVSRFGEFVPYPPTQLTEKDFIDPASETGCTK